MYSGYDQDSLRRSRDPLYLGLALTFCTFCDVKVAVIIGS